MKAMVLAAGRGTRLAELTQSTPKPMVRVGTESVIGHTLRRLSRHGFQDVVVNAHHLADLLMTHVGDGTNWGVQVTWSVEEELLETGGGVCHALSLLGENPFLAVNGDILWDMDLQPLLHGFDPEIMDACLGLVANPIGFHGDFLLHDDGRLQRGAGVAGSMTYCGIQVIHPAALAGFPVVPFSLNRLYDQSMARGRLFGMALSGSWLDMGTPERLALAEKIWG